ncbi:MAG: DUF3073 domain-containing protein [Actinobacteria bacterium]|nr:MAG: DUF3073 domain-containing protein [Actinomycetota bacterium]
MGRGRAKAKQTKVARRLKYSSPSMDLDALRQELSGPGSESSAYESDDVPEGDYEDEYGDEFDEDEDDPYAKYAAADDDEDDPLDRR